MGRNDTIFCSHCYHMFSKKNTKLSFAGYRYCKACWPQISLWTRWFKR